jgi:hypothetical protein
MIPHGANARLSFAAMLILDDVCHVDHHKPAVVSTCWLESDTMRVSDFGIVVHSLGLKSEV